MAGGAAYSLFAALVSFWFTRATGLSLWTLRADASANFGYILAMNVVYWGSWAPLAVLVLDLATRWRIDAASWRRNVPRHVAAGFVIACVHIVVVATGRTLLQRSVGMEVSWSDRVWEMFFRTVDWELTIYCALVGLQHALDYYGEVRVRDLREAQLETRLVEAQLQALQRQLHPHFLFNTLHAISALVHREPDKADAMIERLSDLLRLTLDKVGVQEVTLEQELDYLRAYLDIEQVHFGDRLEIIYDVDAQAMDALVPNMVLQPLAENAIRHGLEPRSARGRLAIEAFREGETLVLRVVDNGRGLLQVKPALPAVARPDSTGRAEVGAGLPALACQESPGRAEVGVGLLNTRARLERLYGAAATLEIRPNAGGGVAVTVRFPFKSTHENPSFGGRRSAFGAREDSRVAG
jgi:two-component system, LytTR family, sensor kinase